jgi:hypothetical protein
LYVPAFRFKLVSSAAPFTTNASEFAAVYIPIAETPLEQVDVAVATKCTGDDTVAPLSGDDMPTQANAETELIKTMRHTNVAGGLTLI